MKKILLFQLLVLICSSMFAQDRVIKGIVLDGLSGKEPMVGATISLGTGKTTTGTTADYNGEFTLRVPASVQTFTVSYIGYVSKKIHIDAGKNYYEVRLEPEANEVGEVVVTGYQQIDRRKLTASVSELKISDATVGAVKDIDQALAGQIAGLSTVSTSGAPGAPVKIRIRGTASINGTQEPLWVLDGIPLEGTDIPSIDDLNDVDDIYQTSIAGINPSDIDNITVLKDAAATAIYGARAANGVIVITTKKGKEGRPVVNFSTKMTYVPRASIDRLNLLNSDEKVQLELDLLSSEYDYRSHKGGVANILDAAGEYDAYVSGGWSALSTDTQNKINALREINTDWNDILFRSAFNQEYNTSISGGSDRARYYASFGYYDEKGTVKAVENNRYNITLKLSFKLTHNFTVGVSVFANQRKQSSYLTDSNGFTNPVYYSRLANPYFQLYNEDGSYNYDANIQGKESTSSDFNIIEERNNTSRKRRDRSFMGLADFEWKIIPGLKLTSQLGIQYDQYTLKRIADNDSYAMRKEKENATYMNSDGTQSTIFPDGGFVKVTEYHQTQWTWKSMLEWDHRFAKIHDVELMAGTEIRHSESESVYTAAYGYDSRTLTTQPVIFPSESIAEEYPLYQETHQENAYVSWFATGSYTLLHRYTLGGSVRWDGSDVFGVAKKYRYLPLYSVSALWRVTEEPWMEKLKKSIALDNLGIRISYGLQGNIDKNTSPYLIGTFDKVTILPGNTETVIEAETAPNPDLKWEKTRNWNFGLDVSFLNGRINLTADYYYRKSTDLISSRVLPLETGFSSTTINWASMENKGWELALGTTNIATKNFTWSTQVNLGFNTNKVLNESVAENSTYPSREGYPVGAIFAYKTAGLDSDGLPLFVAEDGSLQTAEEFLKLNRAGASTLTAAEQRAQYTYMGTSDPKCSGGFINQFRYKNWHLGVNFFFNLGMKVREQPSYSITNYDRGLNTNRDILYRWTESNTDTKFPALLPSTTSRKAEYIRYSEYNLYNMLDIWVKDCNYFRLQSLRLAYELPGSLLSKVGITSASLSVEARNLFVIASNYDNYLDPESMGNPYAQPISKSFIFGLNINF